LIFTFDFNPKAYANVEATAVYLSGILHTFALTTGEQSEIVSRGSCHNHLNLANNQREFRGVKMVATEAIRISFLGAEGDSCDC
jgi:hypothetical protein